MGRGRKMRSVAGEKQIKRQGEVVSPSSPGISLVTAKATMEIDCLARKI